MVIILNGRINEKTGTVGRQEAVYARRKFDPKVIKDLNVQYIGNSKDAKGQDPRNEKKVYGFNHTV